MFDERAPSEDRELQLEAHLVRAGELLHAERLDEAEHEVHAALRLAPDDVAACNLLGLLRFRAGRYDEAHGIYGELVARCPDDTALRLNLGLVDLRMGRYPDAVEHLAHVVEKNPDDRQAQGYYGLALLRAGELLAARRALLAAGQTEMVRQVDDALAVDQVVEQAVEAAGGSALRAQGVAVDGMGDEATTRPYPSADAAADLGGMDGVPVLVAAMPSTRVQAVRLPVTLSEFLARAELRPAQVRGEPFVIDDEGYLVTRVEGRLPTRTLGVLAASGRLSYQPVARRVRGRLTDEDFGEGEDALFLAQGTGVMVVSPRGGRFTALMLRAGDVLYLREPAVYAFEESLSWENGRVPGARGIGAAGLRLVQFRGEGRLVLRSGRAPRVLRVGGAEVYYVDYALLLGWSGQVVPRQLRGLDGEPTQFLAFTGEGALLLEDQDAPPSE